MEKMGEGECQTSFGELMQGILPGGRKFLVNLRIKESSRVKVLLSPPAYSREKEERYIEFYRHYSKCYKVLRNILSDLGSHDDCFVEVDSKIPVGKGLSSSTADMVAAIRGLSQAMSLAFKDDYISRMLTEIEPNDGLHFKGTSAYHHTTGQLIARFDYIPPLHILGIDLGGVLDTVQFNQRTLPIDDQDMANYESLLHRMKEALTTQDLATVCQIATQSTLAWQKVNPKRSLERVMEIMTQTGAYGVANAHSGTYLGLMYGEDHPDLSAIASRIQEEFQDVRWFSTASCRFKMV